MSKYLRRRRKREVLSGHYYTYGSPVPSPSLPFNREKASRHIVTTRDKLQLQTQVSWHLSQLRVRPQVFLLRNFGGQVPVSGQFASGEDPGMGRSKFCSTLRKESWSKGEC